MSNQEKLIQSIKQFNNKSIDTVPTYRELLKQLSFMNDYQLDCPVTIELDIEGECVPGTLDITDSQHFCLDENIPVIRIPW